MPLYEFRCDTCGERKEVLQSIHKDTPEPKHCGKRMDWVPQRTGIKFTPTVGRDSGVYALDYGRRATEDLTVPGKMARLEREGRVSNPFKSAPSAAPPSESLVEEMFGDARNEELEEAGLPRH